MTYPVRRVVTGQNVTGRSCVVLDGSVEAISVPHDRFVWSSGIVPAAAPADADGANVQHTLEPPRGGSIFRVVEFPPASVIADLTAEQKEGFFQQLFAGMGASHCRVDTSRGPGMHKTATLDYVVVLRGEVTLMLDEGDVTLKPGDLVVQRATNHDWVVQGSEPALLAVVMIPVANGQRI
jgi:mannose-6-phosphate isomerase-like protein (cupin superfamily)